MDKPFLSIYHYFKAHRKTFIVSIALCFLVMVFFASQIKLEEDISKVIPNDRKIEKLNQVFQNSKFLDKLVITVSQKDSTATPNPDSLVAYADGLSQKIEQNLKPYLKKTQYKVDDELTFELFSTINQNLPVFLQESDYQDIDTLIQPNQVKKTLERNFRTLTSPAGIALKGMISADPVGISMLGLKKIQQLQYDENFELYDGYVMTKDQRHLLMFVTPAFASNNTGKNTELFNGLDAIIDSLDQNNHVEATYFGTSVIAAGNAKQLRKDTMFTQGFTVLFLVLFIGYYFRKKRAAFVILVPVAFGALFSLALIYLIKGQISVIALGTGSVVLGIAVNYSLHVFNHYRHTQNMRMVIQDLAMPLTIGGFTTIGGFLCLQFVKSEILKDLGLFAAFSLIGAAFCSLVFLPHLIQTENNPKNVSEHSWIDKISTYKFENHKTVLAIIAVLTIVFGYTARWVSFESDMTSMNYMSDQLKKAEADLNRLNAFSLQSVYLVSSGKNLDDALRQNEKTILAIEKLKQQGIVKKYTGVSSLIISDSLQKQRIKRWNQYWTPEKKAQLLQNLEREGASLKFSSTAFVPFKNLLNKNYSPINKAEVEDIKNNFLSDYISEKPSQSTVVTLIKVDKKLKQQVYDTFENDPNLTVVDKQYLTNRLVEVINDDFNQIALLTSILVFVMLMLTYGRIELALMSFVPMFITWVWILGIMGIFDIRFNIINIIISALIFGLGDDYSIFIMDGLLQEYKTGKKNLPSYKSSILLSGITTIAGLGVLIFAKHPALKSIALIAIIGIGCVMVISQLLIPFLFNYFIKSRTDKGLFPWTYSSWLKAFYGYFIFISGSWSLALAGIVLIKLNPIKSERIKLFYHIIISKFARLMMNALVNVKKTVNNPYKEDFSKPVMIIANHHSVLDILMMLWLNPKIIMLTNNWVRRSPLFGWVVQMADFYQVSEGADGGLELFEDRVKKGYSIMVFPEGTRSPDTTIKRFHKGAFYIAEQLKLDILPAIIHGSSYTLRKGDFMLKDGSITVELLPRIHFEDPAWGNGYAERTKNISRYFKAEYEQLSTKIEGPDYFKEKLIYNYLYKGPIVEWYMRIKLQLEKNYQLFDEIVPKKGKILDIGCGYGFMTYMLQFCSKDRQILGIDYDEEKIELAQKCLSRTDKIDFKTADVLNFNFEKYDAIVLSDILHYLQADEQTLIIERCIDSLNPNGKMIIRDGNEDLKDRHRGTKLSEFFSTKVVGFNKMKSEGLSYLSTQTIKQIAQKHGLTYQEIDNTQLTSNLILILQKQ